MRCYMQTAHGHSIQAHLLPMRGHTDGENSSNSRTPWRVHDTMKRCRSEIAERVTVLVAPLLEQIRATIAARRITIVVLARMAGLPRNTIHETILNGSYPPTLRTLVGLTTALDLPLSIRADGPTCRTTRRTSPRAPARATSARRSRSSTRSTTRLAHHQFGTELAR